MYNSTVFSVFTDTRGHCHSQSQNILLTSNRSPPRVPWAVTPTPHLSVVPTPSSTHMLSVSADLPVLDVSYKGEHVIRVLVCGWLPSRSVLSRFICDVARVRAWFFLWLNTLHRGVHRTSKIDPQWLCGCFHLSASVNDAATNVRLQVFVQTLVFTSPGVARSRQRWV